MYLINHNIIKKCSKNSNIPFNISKNKLRFPIQLVFKIMILFLSMVSLLFMFILFSIIIVTVIITIHFQKKNWSL